MSKEGMGSILPEKSNELAENPSKENILTKEEFELKIKKFYPHIVKYCEKFFLGGIETSTRPEDVAQETIIKANNSYKSFKGEYGDASFMSWLQKIAFHTFVEHTRVKKNFNKEDTENHLDIKDINLTPEEELIYKEKRNELYKALEKLPNKERSVLKMNLSMGVGPKEIAEITGGNEGTIKAALSRARKRLLGLFQK